MVENGRKAKIVRCPPSAQNLQRIVGEFAKAGGVVTGFREPRLRLANDWIAGHPDAEVVPFRTWMQRLARLAGEERVRVASPALVQSAVAGVLKELAPPGAFFKARNWPGAARAIARTLDELEDFFFDWDRAAEWGEFDDPLALKVRTLANIRAEVDDRLLRAQVQRFSSLVRTWREQPIEPLPNPPRMLVLLDGPYTSQRGWLLGWAVRLGCEVVLVGEAEHGHFHSVDRYVAELDPDLSELTQPARLGFAGAVTDGDLPTGVELDVCRYPDPLYEAEFALRKAKQFVVEEGIPEIETAILVKGERTLELLLAATERQGIRLSAAPRTQLLGNAMVRLLLDILEGIAKNDPGCASRISRTSYLRLPVAKQRELDEAAHRCKREGTGWEGLPQDIPWVQRLTEWRSVHADQDRPIFDWANLLVDVAEIVESQDTDFHQGPTSERDRRALTRARETLLTHIQANEMGKEPRSLAYLVRLARELWEDAMTTPFSTSEGFQVATSMGHVGSVQAVIALGLAEGTFPGKRREDPVFGDLERRALNEAFGIELPTSHEGVEEDHDEFARLLGAANRIVVSYPAAEGDGSRQSTPAGPVAHILQRLGKEPRVHLRDDLFGEPERRSSSDERLADALANDPRQSAPLALSAPDEYLARHPIRKPHSIRELEIVRTCSFQRVASFQARLETDRPSTRYHQLTRLPSRAKLHRATSPEDAVARFESALDDWLEEIRFLCPDHEVRLLEVAARQRIPTWVTREFLARERWPREVVQDDWTGELGGIWIRADALLRSTIDNRMIVRQVAAGALVERGQIAERRKFEVRTRIQLAYRILKGDLPPVIEYETLGNERYIVGACVPPFWRNDANGLELVGLVDAGNEADAWRDLKRDNEDDIRRARQAVSELRLDARSGDQCNSCDYGDLCRRARGFSEEEDPFGVG